MCRKQSVAVYFSIGTRRWGVARTVVRHFVFTSLHNSAAPFYCQLLLWLQPPDISCILNFRVDVVGANQYVSILSLMFKLHSYLLFPS